MAAGSSSHPDEAAGGPRRYLDWASTAPLHPVGRQALLAALDEGWADPTRLHREARRARLLLDAARETVAELLGARPDEVSFTRSGTESVHLAILGTLAARRRVGDLLVTTAVEHSAVLYAAAAHEDAGGRAIRVPVDEHGRVEAATMPLGPATALVSVQTANQEIGTLQPVPEVAARCATFGIPLHVDAAMTVGRLPVRLPELGANLLTASAAKFGGPPGVGLLVVRTGTRWRRPGPDDERGDARSVGRLDVPGAVATAAALAARVEEIETEALRLTGYVTRLRQGLPARVPDLELHGDPDPRGRLPGLLSLSCLYVDGEALVGELDRAGLAVASGSACTAASLTPSHVLEAIGALTHGNVRLSFGRTSTDADVSAVLDALPAAVRRLRSAAGVQQL